MLIEGILSMIYPCATANVLCRTYGARFSFPSSPTADAVG